MLRYFKKSQALVEMGILAGVTLFALGIVVSYVAKLNSDQYMLMDAFRYALKKSHDENRIIAYGTWDDRHQASVQQPIIGDKIQSSGAAYVMWAIPSVENQGEDPESSLYVKINEIEYPADEEKGGAIAPEYLTFTTESINVHNSNGNIKSNRSASAIEGMSYEIGGEEGMTVYQGRAHARTRPW